MAESADAAGIDRAERAEAALALESQRCEAAERRAEEAAAACSALREALWRIRTMAGSHTITTPDGSAGFGAIWDAADKALAPGDLAPTLTVARYEART